MDDGVMSFVREETAKLGAWMHAEAIKIVAWVMTAIAAVLVKVTGADKNRDIKSVLADAIGTLALYHILVMVFFGLDVRWELSLGLSAIMAVGGWLGVYHLLTSLVKSRAGGGSD